MKPIKVESFQLSEVILRQGSIPYQRMKRNTEYLLSLDPDRILCNYRIYAKLDTKVPESYGGWEGHWSDIRGTFVGHYITALCNTFASTLEEQVREQCKARVTYLVDSLEEVQTAIATIEEDGYPKAFGYLAAIPTTQLDCIEQQTKPGVWSDGAPYYLHHKMLRGLLHAYRVLGIQKAHGMALAMATYFYERNKGFSKEKLERMLNSHRYPVQYFKEFGGMQEVLIQWYEITGDTVFQDLSGVFDRESFRLALIQNRDELGKNMQHANSEVPCVVGMAKYYESHGDEDYRTGVLNFLNWMEEDHSSPIGAISGKSAYPDYDSELFHYPKIMYNHMVSEHMHVSSGESCCSHNLNLLSEHAFAWTENSAYMDRFETRLVNAVLGQQDEKTGMFVYNLNIQQGSKKEFGTQDDSFWCCYCSGVEAFSSLQYGAFHKSGNVLWINQFIAADVAWNEQGVSIRCETDFPNDGKVRLEIAAGQPKELVLHIRKPHWVCGELPVFVNGKQAETKEQHGYLMLCRSFADGDVVEWELPFTLRTGYLLDRPEYGYLFYGPHLLVAVGYDGKLFPGSMDDLMKSLKSTGYPREFHADINGRVVWMPLAEVRNEVYSGFIKVAVPAKQIQTDVIRIGCSESMQAHRFVGNKERYVYQKGKYGLETEIGGSLEYTVQIDPNEQMQVRCYYNGDDTHFFGAFDAAAVRIRLFDLQVKQEDGSYRTFATQTIDKLNPHGEDHINYPIPLELTIGKTELTLRLAAKNFGTANGVVGGLYDQIEVFYLGQ